MIDWRIVLGLSAFTAILFVFAFAFIESRVSSIIELRRLKRRNRTIDAEQAMANHEAGNGILVRNRSLLPGEWWYLNRSDLPSEDSLIQALREFGYVVTFKNRNVSSRMRIYEGKVEEVLEAFED